MTWYAWVMVGVIVLSTGTVLGKIGQHREPITGWEAALIALTNGAFVWGIVALAGSGS